MPQFDDRLKKAIERGNRRGDAHEQSSRQKALTEEEYKRLHSQYRLALSEHIEACLHRLPQHFPGFQYEAIYGERGWGAACRRDDFAPGGSGKRTNLYSRIELTIRPYSHLHVIELTAKGTVRNKEIFNRSHFEKLTDVDPDDFIELIDQWVIEYAEMFAASR